MIYLIVYILLIVILYLFYSFVQKKQLKNDLSSIYYQLEKIGFKYCLAINQNWDRIYKNDKETKILLLNGRNKFFKSKKHNLKKMFELYKSYDFEYLDKLLGKQISKQEYKNIEKDFQKAFSAINLLKGIRKVLVIMSIGILHFFISNKKYA